jgi:Mrp family chromosome partitioning ATPase
VLVVEADLRCPKMAERLGLDGSQLPGLVEAIATPHLGIADVARKLSTYNLSVVLAGQCPATPYELLQSPRLGELLDEARRHYDYVVIDTPPIVAFPDCRIIGRWVDGWLIVVAAHRTSRTLLEEALDLMEEKKTIGFVFTHDERFRSGGRYYGGYYGARSGRAAISRSR